MKNKCTILVSSCDGYSDIWYPFFKIMKNEWPDRPWPIVLNTESKSFDFEDMDIKTFNFYKEGEKVNWGERLIKHLKHIDTEYILFLLDDFFFINKVDQKKLEQCIRWMDEDKTISVFSFWDTPGNNIKDNKYENFELRPKKGEYRLNCQSAIWRREKLIKYILPHENPWQWEEFGSIRSQKYKESFYSSIINTDQIIPYNYRNCGLIKGKWTKSVCELFEKHNIQIDYNIRGFVGKIETTINPGMENRYKYEVSMFKSVGIIKYFSVFLTRLYKKFSNNSKGR